MKKKYIQPTVRELEALPTHIIAASGGGSGSSAPGISSGGSTDEQNVRQLSVNFEW